MQLDDVSHDGEAEPEPAVSAADRRLALSESVEDERKELAANALARVADRDPRHRVAALEPDIDAAARRRELDGVGEEVPDHLLQAAVIGRHGSEGRIQTRLQPNAFGIGGRLHRFHRGHDDGDQIDGPDVQAELARDDAGHVEQVFDQLSQEAGVALDHLRPSAGAGGIERPRSEKAHPSQNGVERRAELVRKRREELVLGAVGRIELPARLLEVADDHLVGAHVAQDADRAIDGAVRVAQGRRVERRGDNLARDAPWVQPRVAGDTAGHDLAQRGHELARLIDADEA